MKYCRVVGPMWAAVKHPAFDGRPLFVVQPLDEQGKDAGASYVAIDTVQAGVGDFVYLVGSREAALALDPSFVPVDAAIVGIVDGVDV